MKDLTKQVGFSQRVRLEWLEKTANLVLAGNDKQAINDALQSILEDKVSIGGNAVRGNREKIITILMKVWLTTPSELEALRDVGLELLKVMPRGDHVAVHWGMVMAAYPFWADVATQTGRLLKLQNSAAAVHIQRRVREQYGERETVSRAARRALRSYLDWDVLKGSGEKGIYIAGTPLVIEDPKLIAWLLEASLRARGTDSATLRDLVDSPNLFPFKLKQLRAENLQAASSGLDIVRQGMDEDLVMLRKQPGKGGAR